MQGLLREVVMCDPNARRFSRKIASQVFGAAVSGAAPGGAKVPGERSFWPLLAPYTLVYTVALATQAACFIGWFYTG